MNTYTVVYRLRNQFYVIRYLSDSHIQISDDALYAGATYQSHEAEVWGLEIARWGDD